MKAGALVALLMVVAIAWLAWLRPRPTSLVVTARAGDDTVVINQRRPTRLHAWVRDQYARNLSSDTAVRYQLVSGDSIAVSSKGALQCNRRSDAVVRATFERLTHQFLLHCRPVASVEMSSWVDLVAGDSARDLPFVAHGVDGRPETELRGVVSIDNPSVATVEGMRVRPKRPGNTVVVVDVGDERAHTPIVVYDSVKSFVDNRRKAELMAMHVSLARGDTILTPVPKGAFWVTYFSRDSGVAPPTIELRGDGLCTLGNGISARRIAEGEYAKYCYSGTGAQMMIAHGTTGAVRVSGVVALRLVW